MSNLFRSFHIFGVTVHLNSAFKESLIKILELVTSFFIAGFNTIGGGIITTCECNFGLSQHRLLLDWYEQPKHYALILERPVLCEDLVEFSNCSDTDEEMAMGIILQLFNALKHCEIRGVRHRDVKPENILEKKSSC